MTCLPKNHHQLADIIHGCIDLSDYEDGVTLKEIIEMEMNSHLCLFVVEAWLRGLPSSCTIPFMDSQIEEMLISSGCSHWTVDGYWRWAADRVMSFAKHPKVYE